MEALVFTSATYSDYTSSVLDEVVKDYPRLTFSYSSLTYLDANQAEEEMSKYGKKYDGFIFLLHDGENRFYLYDKLFQSAANYTQQQKKFLFMGIVTNKEKSLLDVPGTIHFYPYPVTDTTEIVNDLLETIASAPTRLFDNGYMPEMVEPAQKFLAQLGIYSGNFTGEADDYFVTCLKEYKKSRGLKYLARLNQETLRHLELDVAEKHGKEEYENKKSKLWILKYFPKDFDQQNLKVGDVITVAYGPHFPDKKGEQKIARLLSDDEIWTYDNYSASIKHRISVNRFEPDEIKFQVEEVYEKEIPLKLLKTQPDLSDKLIARNSARLFEVGDRDEIDLKKLIASYLNLPNRTLDNVASYSSDLNFRETPDQLDFLHDVEAFANIITLKKIEPPLAIGLFGHWGSGKSFFMEKLSERITYNTVKKDPKLLNHVVQVKFNSWHYSDGNLWASLISHIFESLNDYAVQRKFGDELVNEIYAKLSITNVQLSETKLKIEAKDSEVKSIEHSIQHLEETINDKRSKLDSLTIKDYFSIIVKDPEIVDQLSSLRSKYIPEQTIRSTQEIIQTTKEFQGFANQISKTIKIFKDNKGWNWIVFWVFLAVFVGFIILLNYGPVEKLLTAGIKPLITWIGSIAIIFSGARKQLKPYYEDVKKFYERVSRLKDAAISKQKSIVLKEEDEKEKLKSSLAELGLQKEALEAEKIFRASEKLVLECQLEDISKGKMLSSFFAEKSTDENYAKHLGIVSWIRKDFAQLSNLLAQQAAVNEKVGNDDAEDIGKVRVDRIVLFIDDLDRCSGETVVKMLEAIHLLLAFKLFVVVVGVDPRWLNNALDSQFGRLFGQNGDSSAKIQNAVTSYDYLEKIFQIPFALKPMSDHGRSKLVSYLTSEDLEENQSRKTKKKLGDKILRHSTEINDAGYPSPTHVFSDDPELEPVIPGMPIVDFVQGNRIVLSSEEIAFMQLVAANFNTPRTIKRFVNIYRLIKAHRSYKFIAGTQKMDFVPTMVLLSVIVGCPDSAQVFLQGLREKMPNVLLGDLIMSLKDDDLTKFFGRISVPDIDQLILAELRENLELISRFSFRTYLS